MSCYSTSRLLPVFHVALSSAYRDNLVLFSGISMSLIIMRNRNGLITLPCGVAFSSLHDLESDDPILTYASVI